MQARTVLRRWLAAKLDIDKIVYQRRSRLAKLRAVGDPIDFRKQEVAAREAVATKAQRFVELATGALGDWPKSKPWLNETDTADFGKQVPSVPCVTLVHGPAGPCSCLYIICWSICLGRIVRMV